MVLRSLVLASYQRVTDRQYVGWTRVKSWQFDNEFYADLFTLITLQSERTV